MERLTGVDAGLLYMETPTAHMHTMKIAVLETPGGRVLDRHRIRGEMLRRLSLLPPFRRRLVEVPFGLHHPVWVDVEVDIDAHLHWVTADPPGSPRQLDEIVSRIASLPLERSKPLWEVWMVEGLEGGRIAAIAKIHHAVADGVAVAALLQNALGPVVDAAHDAPRTEPLPTPRQLLREAFRDHRQQIRRLPALVRRTATNLAGVARRRKILEPSPPLPLRDAPYAAFNGALTRERVFASTTLPLADVKAVRAAFDVTVNDVALAVVAGAIRRYLVARNVLPTKPLLAEVPASTDTQHAARISGNHLSNIFTSLCTDVADPVERLRAIGATARSAKEIHEQLGSEMYQEWSRFAPPRAFASFVRLYSRLKLADRHRPPINVIVSSVPGPREPLEFAGVRLVDLFSVGPIIEGAALNVTAWSYVDHFNVGVLSCPGRLDDPHEITEGIRRSLDELVAAIPAEREHVIGA